MNKAKTKARRTLASAKRAGYRVYPAFKSFGDYAQELQVPVGVGCTFTRPASNPDNA